MYLNYADHILKLCWSYIEIMLIMYLNYAHHVFKLCSSCIYTSLIILTSFVLTWFITEKSHFLKNSKKIFLSKWAEFLCVPKGHMWDSLCEITANFVNPPCLGEVLKFRKRAFFKCVPVKQF